MKINIQFSDKIAKIAYFLSPFRENFITISHSLSRKRDRLLFPFSYLPSFLRVFIAIFELYIIYITTIYHNCNVIKVAIPIVSEVSIYELQKSYQESRKEKKQPFRERTVNSPRIIEYNSIALLLAPTSSYTYLYSCIRVAR